MKQRSFELNHVLSELKHYLPAQSAIKDFIHHNSLHAYQEMKFYDAIFKASKIFGYQVTLQLDEFRELYRNGRIREEILDKVITTNKGFASLSFWKDRAINHNYDTHRNPRIGKLRSEWRNRYNIDPDNLLHPLLFRVVCSYLDQGIATWKFPIHSDGFIASLRSLEQNGSIRFFKTKQCSQLLASGNIEITALLERLVGKPAFYEQYLFDQQFAHPGWSGLISALERNPGALLDQRKISLEEFIQFELLLEIDTLNHHLQNKWKPLCSELNEAPIDLFADIERDELHEIFQVWQEAFEWSYYDEVLAGLQKVNLEKQNPKVEKSFAAIFCIDERECSLRRHIEHVDPYCETYGAPGFFGVEFYFQPEGGKFYDKLCPAPVTPKYLIKEINSGIKRKHDVFYHPQSHRLAVSTLSSFTLGFAASIRLIKNIVKPTMSPAISDAFAHMNESASLTIENTDVHHIENNLQIGFTIEEMTTRVAGQLRGMGMIENFAPLVYVVAHGSSSANNPHHGAHDCGACSGRPGSVNARVFAHMANHPGVRKQLKYQGIHIPEATQFIGALHDTAADEIRYFDENILIESNRIAHHKNKANFETALDLNAKERSRRFSSINTKASIQSIRKSIKHRSVSLFEPRPELGHGTNTLCIIGRREISKNLFLDRRAFLNSYDYQTDPTGDILPNIMRPIGPVCGGINLEYYFSRVDNYRLGAGTKLPHNVMGLIGVANSSDGDLRPGLPLQMIEVHDPVRLLIIVEHFPEVVLKTIQSSPEMYEWYINEWVHLIAFDPITKNLHEFKDGVFIPYKTLLEHPQKITNILQLFEDANEMETNQIADATKENLPVYTLH
jgi:uncharacterized protein YbcC (UPF0753/DUF2309 family)